MTITPLPHGATDVDEDFGLGGTRNIFGPHSTVGTTITGDDVTVGASAQQYEDGRIEAMGARRPWVSVGLGDSPSILDAETARQLAAALLKAADLCDGWGS